MYVRVCVYVYTQTFFQKYPSSTKFLIYLGYKYSMTSFFFSKNVHKIKTVLHLCHFM